MSPTLKTALKYLLTLGIGIFLLWYLISQQSQEARENIITGFKNADYTWIALTLLIALFEKIVRAYRWNLLLEPLSYKPFLKNTFYSVMIAYLANIFAPRMGEVARCAILNRTDNIPINASFGTVVSERVIDFLCLLLIIPIALLFEYEKISELLIRSWQKMGGFFSENQSLFIILILAASGTLILLFAFRSKVKKNKFYEKISGFVRGVIISLLSIRNMKRRGEFIFTTILIWACYYLMTYFAFFSLEATSGLSMPAGLVVLVSGALGMAAPVQGGIGTFHAIVKETLEEVYRVSELWSLPYAFIVHTSQTALAFFVGIICLIFVLSYNRKNKTQNVSL